MAGVGLIVAGLAPENVNVEAHTAGALIGRFSLNLGMILLGSVIVNVQRWLGVMAMTAGSVGFIGLGLFLSQAGPVPLGVAERIADYPGTVMVVVLGVFLLVAVPRGESTQAT